MPAHSFEQNWALLVHDTSRLIRRRFDLAIKDLGLTQAKWRVLATLHRSPGLSQSELAERLDIEKAPLGLALEWLDQAGWIRRETDRADRRARRVYLREQSTPTLKAMEERFRQVEGNYLRGFDEAEVAELLDALQAVRQTLRRSDTPVQDASLATTDTYLSVLFECARLLIRRFDVRLDSQRLSLALIGSMMNLRSRLSGIATGDQGIFVARHAFEAQGGFPAIALMEDIAFSRVMRRVARPACLRSKMFVSARRWERRGVVRTVLQMWSLRAAYFFGASPDWLHQQYYGRSPLGDTDD